MGIPFWLPTKELGLHPNLPNFQKSKCCTERWSSDQHAGRRVCVFWMEGKYKERVTLSLGEGDDIPLQCSCLENPMDGGAWWAAVHGVAESRTLLSNFTFTFHFHALEKEMATHSSVLACKIPGTGEPGGLQSMGSRRVGHDWSDLAAAVTLGLRRDVIHYCQK